MKTSENINEIATALSLFQSELPVIEKNATVVVKTLKGSYTFNYAPLDTITQAIRPLLKDHGLSFIHTISDQKVECILLHKSGQCINTGGISFAHSNKMQEMGSSITYANRYTLCAPLGIDEEHDDEHNSSDGNKIESLDNRKWLNKNTPVWDKAVEGIKTGKGTVEDIAKAYKLSKKNRDELQQIENAAWDTPNNGTNTIPSAKNPKK